jgi:hypothetical protein
LPDDGLQDRFTAVRADPKRASGGNISQLRERSPDFIEARPAVNLGLAVRRHNQSRAVEGRKTGHDFSKILPDGRRWAQL